MERLAYKITEVPQVAPVCKTKVYEAINSGELRARKKGASTIIMRDDLEAWLRSLPDYKPSQAAA